MEVSNANKHTSFCIVLHEALYSARQLGYSTTDMHATHANQAACIAHLLLPPVK